MTSLTKKILSLAFIATFAVACTEATSDPTTPEKDAVDPDSAVSDKADRLTRNYVSLAGHLDMGESVDSVIDWPDYFHGYTFDLDVEQTVSVRVGAGASGLFRIYGPSRAERPDGSPVFGRALIRSHTEPASKVGSAGPGTYVAVEEFTAPEAGRYMVVFGPDWTWTSKYTVSLECTGGCRRGGECTSDTQCATGEFCGDNGVRCITFPCDANFDVCQPKIDPVGSCSSEADCGADEWCRSTDFSMTTKECVPFVGEGASCSGFAPPQFVDACSPELTCIFRPFVADAPGACRNKVTVAELDANPDTWNGKRVFVDGFVNMGFAMCTKMACGPSNPCCNSCGASLLLADEDGQTGRGLELEKDGDTFGCGGNECTIRESCDITEGHYQVLGVFEVGEFANKLVVETVVTPDTL